MNVACDRNLPVLLGVSAIVAKDKLGGRRKCNAYRARRSGTRLREAPCAAGTDHSPDRLSNCRPSRKTAETMGDAQAAAMLAALGHALRLRLWHLLAPHGHVGLPAGLIATTMNVLPSSLSFHLRMMTQAGVLTQRRSSRKIIYAVNTDTVRSLCATLIGYETGEEVSGQGVDLFGDADGERQDRLPRRQIFGETPP
jgi:ArsR family transcriptional regulator, arsenate/arsenite/antimonite-responsive transcriptional repressor